MWQILPIMLLFVCGLAGGVVGHHLVLVEARPGRARRAQAARRRTGRCLRAAGYGAPPPGWGRRRRPAVGVLRIAGPSSGYPPPAAVATAWIPAAATTVSAAGVASRLSTAAAADGIAAVASIMASDDIRPFRVEVPEAVLEDLRDRLARTRWPDQIPGSGWDYGTDLAYLQELCEYWRTTFDWRAQEDRFNRWPHFLTEIDGQQIHFIHARSDDPDALPLIISHGWPGSVSEFLDVIEPLRENVPRGRAVAARLRLVGSRPTSPVGTCNASPTRGPCSWRASATTGTARRVATGAR